MTDEQLLDMYGMIKTVVEKVTGIDKHLEQTNGVIADVLRENRDRDKKLAMIQGATAALVFLMTAGVGLASVILMVIARGG